MQADGLTICMAVLAAIAMLLCEFNNRKWMKQMEAKETMQNAERADWANERDRLLSRVMAPDLQAYTNSVIKVKNAEKPKDDEQPPIDWAG